MTPSVCGIGYLGVGPYETGHDGVHTREHYIWTGMIKRCYQPNNERNACSYRDSIVDPVWHNFQSFAAFYHSELDKYNRYIDSKWGWHLDKDLLIPGNSLYAPERCCLVPGPINKLLNDYAHHKKDLPLGVSRHGKGFRARCHSLSGPKTSQVYSSSALAQLAYWTMKFEAIRSAALEFCPFLPPAIFDRLANFGWSDVVEYYGESAVLA